MEIIKFDDFSIMHAIPGTEKSIKILNINPQKII